MSEPNDTVNAIALTLRHDVWLLDDTDPTPVKVLAEAKQIWEHHVKPHVDDIVELEDENRRLVVNNRILRNAAYEVVVLLSAAMRDTSIGGSDE